MTTDSSDRTELWLATSSAAEHFEPDALSAADRRRYERIRRADKRRDFTVSRALLRRLQIEAAPLGRLSHSGGIAAVLRVDAAIDAGVDVETHAARRLDSLARFAFTTAEADAIEMAAGQERERLFYALWTLKEAFAKALRRPLLETLRHCRFLPVGAELQGSIPDPRPWHARVFEPRPDVSVAVAFIGTRTPPCLRIHEWPGGAMDLRWPEPFRVIANETSLSG